MERRTRLLLIFPYSASGTDVYSRIGQIIGATFKERLHCASESRPLIVFNADTENRGHLKAFREFATGSCWYPLLELCEFYRVYSVDTCQMWLAGFGKILDDIRDHGFTDNSVLLLPGDLKDIRLDFRDFTKRLFHLVVGLDNSDIVVGDFEVPRGTAKDLIDQYGTFPLLYNWFPRVAVYLREFGIIGPARSSWRFQQIS